MGQLTVHLDRSTPMPLYYQVARQMEAAIAAGELRPGERLENEVDLADRLGLSRPTMRRAIQELVNKGLLVRKRGVGTQVVAAQVHRSVALTSLYDDLSRDRQNPATAVLALEHVAAEAPVAEALGVPPGDPVLYIERLRSAAGKPLAVMRNWLPAEVVTLTRDDLEAHGLYELLRAAGVYLRIATQRIGARGATAVEGRLLGERKGAPLVKMERISYDDAGRPVELARHVYRASAYTFETTLVER